MMLHKKHSPMEIFVHATLFYSMMSTAVCTALEAAWRENPLLTAGRTTGMFLQGAWFIAAARMLYGGKGVVPLKYNRGEEYFKKAAKTAFMSVLLDGSNA
jgi:hypothetical protein